MKSFRTFSEEQAPRKKPLKAAVMETEFYGAMGYHGRCLEPGCEWKSKPYNRANQAVAAIKKHHREHLRNP